MEICTKCGGAGGIEPSRWPGCEECSGGLVGCFHCRDDIDGSTSLGTCPCTRCHGRGDLPCPICSDIDEDCAVCSHLVSGRVICPHCDGTGDATCSVCKGSALIACVNCTAGLHPTGVICPHCDGCGRADTRSNWRA